MQGVVVEAGTKPGELLARIPLQLPHALERMRRAPVPAVARLRSKGNAVQCRLRQHHPSAAGRGAGKLFHCDELAPQLVEAAQAAVGVTAARRGELVAGHAQISHPLQELLDGGPARRAAGKLQLAVPVQDAGHLVHGVERHAEAHAALHGREVPARNVPDPVVPLFLEVDPAGDLVELLEPGIDARFEGKLAQQTGGERVNGLNVSAHQAVQRSSIAGAFRLGGALEPFVQAIPDPGAQLAGGLLGEGDHDDLVDLGDAAADDLQHAFNQDPRLAGAGTRFQEETGAEIAGGGAAYLLVDRFRTCAATCRRFHGWRAPRAAVSGCVALIR